MNDRDMLRQTVQALEDLSFECFGGIGTTPPSVETYNRTFGALENARDYLAVTEPAGRNMADEEFPRKGRSESGNCISWTVEARSSLPFPRSYCGKLLGERWSELKFPDGQGHGVPDGPRWLFEGRNFGHLSYPAAQALRWWFLANAHAASEDNGLETRLVRHEIKYERSEVAAEAVEPTDGRLHLG